MNPLQYTSEEMFSSTELIRKSKLLFDKLHNNEIEKAIILRDGKPSFMLLDFAMYEKLMNEYISLKELEEKQNIKIDKSIIQKEDPSNGFNKNIEMLDEKEILRNDTSQIKELNEKDLEEALAQIEKLDLDNIAKEKTMNTNIIDTKEDKEPLKEFWE